MRPTTSPNIKIHCFHCAVTSRTTIVNLGSKIYTLYLTRVTCLETFWQVHSFSYPMYSKQISKIACLILWTTVS